MTESQNIDRDFIVEVRKGLSCFPKSIPCKFLYDEEGGRIYQKITELKEYYPLACEMEILARCKEEIARLVAAPVLDVVELGPGDGAKAAILLHAMVKHSKEVTFHPFDINQFALNETLKSVEDLEINPLIGDFSRDVSCLNKLQSGRKVVLFLGSSIGNFNRLQVNAFLNMLRQELNAGDLILIGFDLEQNPAKLMSAYSDPYGVTRDFNLNLLTRINRELGGEFRLETFEHAPRFNSQINAMESYLRSRFNQSVAIKYLDLEISFLSGEEIHTESSFKFSLEGIETVAKSSGLKVIKHFQNIRSNYSISMFAK